jgi:hypothetical protein
MLKQTPLILIFCLGLTHPSFAHNVKNNHGVGGTFHIEPQHNPRAGEPSQAWFALTTKGGKVIPLEDCNCQLEVNMEEGEKEKTIATPKLQPISTENYQGIPSATITFPKAGIYELAISGSPKSGSGFSPFELNYEVVVSGNSSQTEDTHQQQQTANATITDTNETPETTTSGLNFGWIFGCLGGMAVIGGLILLSFDKSRK